MITEKAKIPKILIVDDEEKNLKLIAAILMHYGYELETAKNGIEALEKTKTFSPDLIFLDVMMPEMDGYEACRRLKQDQSTNHVPVIMVTSLADRDSKIKELEAGANDFLTKPHEAIQTSLGDGRTMPEHFDPQILQVFKDCHKQFEDIYESYRDLV